MCGIAGVVTSRRHRVSIDDDALIRMRDRLAHRGPDDAGICRPAPHVALAHRRLSVIDPSPAGRQPMTRPDGSAIVYNGELYNDRELRRDMRCAFATSCDTETVLELFATHTPADAAARLRGMYALAFYDAPADRLVLARDPLGVKPLYYWIGRVRDHEGSHTEVAFASEPCALLEHPAVDPAPDLTTVSAYLTTIRTTLGRRTLYAGINCVLPGELVELDLSGADPVIARSSPPWDERNQATDLDACIEDSVTAHLRADVPLCCLLSGGLDSSIIAAIAARHTSEPLRTFCAGDAETLSAPDSDFAHARLVASAIGADHTEIPITRALFRDRWPDMIRRMSLPLSTPNEVAINEVARAIRSDGAVVTLSGEGADELFAGYEAPMGAAVACIDAGFAEPGLFHLASSAWAPPHGKAQLLSDDAWRSVEHDEPLHTHYCDEFAAIQAELESAGSPADPLRAHLHLQQRINLPGLLQRLDSATMLEGVEGRTPFADPVVAALSRRIPMRELYRPEAAGAPARTKLALRTAFASLPREVVGRPKASFPLPFQEWMADHAHALSCDFARTLFQPHAIDLVRRDPGAHWNLAWPMINLALWQAD